MVRSPARVNLGGTGDFCRLTGVLSADWAVASFWKCWCQSESLFNSALLFAPQKKAEAAHRILEGLGPQVELVSHTWLGGSWVGKRNWVQQQVVNGGEGKEEGKEEVLYYPALSPRGGRKQHLLIRALADNS